MSDAALSWLSACAHCGLPVAGKASSDAEPFCCFGCRFASGLARPAGGGTQAGGTLVLRLLVGGFLTMNIMVFSWLNYARELFPSGIEGDARARAMQGLFSYLLLLLTTVVMVALGGPLLEVALKRRRGEWPRADANLLILIGVTAAYGVSVASTIAGRGGIYYDTAAAILLLVTLGGLLESRAKRKALEAARALLEPLPPRAWVRRGGELVEIDRGDLRVGDVFRVRPGEAAPADGRIAEGESHFDEAWVTGESRPRAAGPGEAVLAGTISRDGQVLVVAERVGAASLLARVEALLEGARAMQPPIQRLADRTAAWFVPAVVVLALAVFGFHSAQGESMRGLLDALSVLLISCPCALGMAAPLAAHFALGRAARLGVLIDSAVTLERAAAVRAVYFDKTGTLAEPGPALDSVEPAPGVVADEALGQAAALESSSLHPVARALVDAARAKGIAIAPVREARVLPGRGIEGTVAGRRLQLGGDRLLAERGLGLSAGPDDCVRVALLDEDGLRATFRLEERPREGAREAIEALGRLGVETAILTGDRAATAHRFSAALGLTHQASLLPGEKLDHLVAARRRLGAPVAMVGDGINDAPVLAAADVGFALGGGADLARRAGNVVVLHDRLERIPQTLALARQAMAAIRINLLWAFGYNLIGVTLAAMGRLNPVVSALLMIGSSLFVLRTSSGAGRQAGEGSRS